MERFSLQLDGSLFQDFAVRSEDQVLLVISFCKVVAGYLHGDGTSAAARPFLGCLGRLRSSYSIEVDDQLFSAVRQRREGRRA